MDYKDMLIEVKGEDIDEKGFFTGLASTFGGEPDSYGDIIKEGAFTSTLSKGGRNGNGIAMLWQHDARSPIGVWKEVQETSKGLTVRGQIAIDTTLGSDAYKLLKMGALNGLSIGYNVKEHEIDHEKNIRILKKVDLWEISLVTFPANIRATITDVKSGIESATNEKELEWSLRNAGLSISASKYIVSLCKHKLFQKQEEKKLESLNSILNELKAINKTNRRV